MLPMIKRLLSKKKEAQVDSLYYPDDVFLVSYPKSGNTWLRFLIANYLSGDKCDFSNSHLIVPDIHYNPSDCRTMNRPRIMKSHNIFNPNYPKVIYLVRDGRDVAVSYYYHQKKYYNIDNDKGFLDFLTQFNLGEVGSFGMWGDHVLSWLDNKEDNLLMVRYEDLRLDPEYFFSKILQFCGLDVDHDRVVSAVNQSSLKNMQRIEAEQHNKIDLLSKSDPSISFVRRGSCGEWKDYFNDEMLHEFHCFHGKALLKVGYDDK